MTLTSRLNDIRTRLLQSSLEELAATYTRIEEETTDGTVRVVMEHLETHRADIRGSVFLLESRPYQLHLERRSTAGEQVLSFLPKFDTRSKMDEETIDHNGFGAIHTTRLIYPHILSRFVKPLRSPIESWVTGVYDALETATLSGIRSLNILPLRGLHDILEKATLKRKPDTPMHRTWFSVSRLDEQVFRYQFSDAQLRTLAAHLKADPLPEYSPFECILALLTQEVTDSVLDGRAEFDNGVYTLPLIDLASMDSSACFWNAERRLFECPALSAIEIATVSAYDLQLNVPANDSQLYRDIIEDIRPVLESQFERNMEEYKRAQRTITRIATPIVKATGYQFIVRFISDILSETFVKITRRLGQ